MKRSKITRAMDHIDDSLIAQAAMDTQSSRKGGSPMKGKFNWKQWTAVAAMFVLLVTGVVLISQNVGAQGAIVALDVNPSLEIEVNAKGRVEEVIALNEDAEIVIGTQDFHNVPLDVTINALIGSMLQHNYLNENQNSILVSIDAKSSHKANDLQKTLSESIAQLLQNQNINASVITQTYDKDETHDNNSGVSAAKACLIKRIVEAGLTNADGVVYTYEELVALTVNELKLILDSKGIQVGGLASTGTASDGNLIGTEQALAIALAKSAVTKEEVVGLEVEFDFNKKFKAMVYEIEFHVGDMEHEYEIHGVTGEILEEKVKSDREDDKDEDEATLPEGAITIENALAAAYAHAGVSAEDAREVEWEVEKERGKVVYSIEFKSGMTEYEYAIDVMTGEIVTHEWELDF